MNGLLSLFSQTAHDRPLTWKLSIARQTRRDAMRDLTPEAVGALAIKQPADNFGMIAAGRGIVNDRHEASFDKPLSIMPDIWYALTLTVSDNPSPYQVMTVPILSVGQSLILRGLHVDNLYVKASGGRRVDMVEQVIENGIAMPLGDRQVEVEDSLQKFWQNSIGRRFG